VPDDDIRETCGECGFDAAHWEREPLSSQVRGLAEEWTLLVASVEPARMRERPQPEVWSPLEYTVHTARIVEYWVDAAAALARGEKLSMDKESYPDADHLPFNGVAIATASDDLFSQLVRLAAWNDAASEEELAAPLRMTDATLESMWHRLGVRDAAAALRHAVHDAAHHLGDIERQQTARRRAEET